MAVEHGDLIAAVRISWGADTSSDPDGCGVDNPSWGQCAVTSLVVHDHLGGTIMRGEIAGIVHYWNRLPCGRELDLTREQFSGWQPSGPEPEESPRQALMQYEGTRERYHVLAARVDDALSEARPGAGP